MFNLITPKKRADYDRELSEMFERLQLEVGPKFQDCFDHEKANYLIFSHKKFGIIGGARLIPIDAPALTSDLIRRLQFKTKNKIWEISRIFFHIPYENAKDEHEKSIDHIRQDFYLGMYDSLKTISIAQKIKTFVTVLDTNTHQEVLKNGMWPFSKQAKIASPYRDGEEHIVGIMPMNAELYESFVQRRMSMDSINLKS